MELIQHDTCGLIIEKKGKFLLVKRKKEPAKGWWTEPGGHLEKGESFWECAVREGREEVGLVEVEKEPFLEFVHEVEIGHRHRAHFFRARLKGEPKAGSDAGAVRWFSVEEMTREKVTMHTLRIFNTMLFGEADLRVGGIRERLKTKRMKRGI